MAKTPNNPEMPIDHTILSNQEEMSERALARAERAERDFLEQGAQIARDVTFLQTGVKEDVANALSRPGGPGGVGNLGNLGQDTLNRVKEERVQAKLYRAVAGHETYETELGEDSLNYLGSETVDYQRQPVARRMGRKVTKILRGASSMIGTNNFIEARISQRFGENLNVDARRRFVLNRLRGAVTQVQNTMPPAVWGQITRVFNIVQTSTVDDVLRAMERAQFSTLITFRDFCRTNAIVNIIQNQAFWDLMLLVYLDQGETAETGKAQVYDHDRMRLEWNNYAHGAAATPGTTAMRNQVINTVDESALFPLENSPDNKLLLSELRARMYRLMNVGPQTFNANRAGNLLATEIRTIVDQEVPEGALSEEDNTRINTCRTAMAPLLRTAANELAQLRITGRTESISNRMDIVDSTIRALNEDLTYAEDDLDGGHNLPSNGVNQRRYLIDPKIRGLNEDLTYAEYELPDQVENQKFVTKARRDQIADTIVKLNSDSKDLDKQIADTNRDLRSGRITNDKQILALKNSISSFTAQKKVVTDQIYKLQQEDLNLQLSPVPSPAVTATETRIKELKERISKLQDEGQTRINNLKERIKKLQEEYDTLESTRQKAETSLREAVAGMTEVLTAANAMGFANDPDLVNLINVGGNDMTVFELLGDSTIALTPALVQNISTALSQVQNNVINRLHILARPRVRLSPFTLVQRLMRRDQMRLMGLDPDDPHVYNEEANHIANVRAALRLASIKSVDASRTANQDAANFLNRGRMRRGWDKISRMVAGGQDLIGLEAIDYQNMTADKLLESVINSREEFSVFRGINKFPTTRRVRALLNKTGRVVPRETIRRFTATLEEAISRFKKVRPEMAKGLDPHDWDLTTVLGVLRKLEVELWSRELLQQVDATNSPRRERELVRMLRGSREREEAIEQAIFEDVKNPNAVWRLPLAKNELKKRLNKKVLDAQALIQAQGIENKRAEIAEKQARLEALPENSTARTALTQEIANLQAEIKVVEEQIKNNADLYQKVEKAKEYIETNNLSRKDKKAYLEAMGLTGVFDKMSTNFWMERTWKKTKKASNYIWDKTKKGWKWSRKKFLNAPTAKSGAGKTYEIGALLATPLTYPLGLAYKVMAWPAGLIGRGMGHSVDAPLWMTGQFNKPLLRKYYRKRLRVEAERIESEVAEHENLKKNLPKYYYSSTKKRKATKINACEERIVNISHIQNKLVDAAKRDGIELGELAYYSEVANDNGEIIIKQIAA